MKTEGANWLFLTITGIVKTRFVTDDDGTEASHVNNETLRIVIISAYYTHIQCRQYITSY